MATLQIKKKSLRTWEHIDSQLGMFILSKFEFSTGTETFQVVEANGAKRRIYNISDIEVFDIGGTAETFGTVTQLSLRLEELKYPGFYRDGDFIFGVDPNRVVISDAIGNLQGADVAFYPDLTELSFVKGVTTNIQTQLNGKQATLVSGTNIKTVNGNSLLGAGDISTETTITTKLITSADLTAQTLDGFLTYANALSPVLVIGSREKVDYLVTDTGQTFSIQVNNRSVGTGQPALTSSEVLEQAKGIFNRLEDTFPQNIYVFSNGSTGHLSLYLDASITGTAQATTQSPAGNFTSLAKTRPITGVISAGTAGSSCGVRSTAAGLYMQGHGSIVELFNAGEEASSITDVRSFAGIKGTSTVIGNVDPSTLINIVGLANDSADTNMSIMHNDSSGTATKAPLGSDFPAKYTVGQHIYRLRLYVYPGGTQVKALVTDIITGKFKVVDITTDLPGGSQMYPQTWRNNGATAQAAIMSSFGYQIKNM